MSLEPLILSQQSQNKAVLQKKCPSSDARLPSSQAYSNSVLATSGANLLLGLQGRPWRTLKMKGKPTPTQAVHWLACRSRPILIACRTGRHLRCTARKMLFSVPTKTRIFAASSRTGFESLHLQRRFRLATSEVRLPSLPGKQNPVPVWVCQGLHSQARRSQLEGAILGKTN